MAERLRLWLERAERGYHLRDAATTDESGLRVLIALAPDRSSELVSSQWEHALAGLDSPLMELGRPSGSPDAAVTDPPYRIVSERLVIRCWEPPDAPLLKDAIDSSLEHLQPWMPWAQTEPQLLSEKVALLRRFRGQFDLGRDFVYGIFDRNEMKVVGGTGLHTRVGDDSYEIGYWIRASDIGRGLATEATAALTRVAFEVCGADRVEIRIDPANEISASIPRKLGFEEEGTLRRRLPPHEDGVPRDVTIFALFREVFGSSPASSADLEAYDAGGNRVL